MGQTAAKCNCCGDSVNYEQHINTEVRKSNPIANKSKPSKAKPHIKPQELQHSDTNCTDDNDTSVMRGVESSKSESDSDHSIKLAPPNDNEDIQLPNTNVSYLHISMLYLIFVNPRQHRIY